MGELRVKLGALKPLGSRLNFAQDEVDPLRARSVEQGKAVAQLGGQLAKAVADKADMDKHLQEQEATLDVLRVQSVSGERLG